ncbi:EamA family transporter RarD [Pseudodonghicola flavimaris]|uniref:EamA family transporter RarD n=1 Tax=Pseudodonghicola flavimaris TaxID=3050036 RepID=A0ABT7F5L4_9RHOB|nr:EamA family transporter RarD [Pseudodonghicola flavimaris]MDK3019903.1 EamA family transporter RarD [Pseudodonghicola flavimaris]
MTSQAVTPPPVAGSGDSPQGLAFAVSAYLMWGVLPLFLKLLSHITPVEVVAHRILWSIPVAGMLLIAMGRTGDLRRALTHPKTLAQGALTAALISINWGIYIWSINNGHALDAALGYYINPLFSIFLGAVLLRERLGRAQIAAIALATVAVTILAIDTGRIPWLALTLTLSWGFYSFFKKSLPIGPNQGFLLEVLILMPPALIYVIYLEASGGGHFGHMDADTLLLLACGPVTAIPLIAYANGAKRLRLSTIGILQYITPTMIMLAAVFLFGEPMGRARMIAFPLIWAALAIYTGALLHQSRRRRA